MHICWKKQEGKIEMKRKKSVMVLLLIGLCTATVSALTDTDFQTEDNKDGSVTITKYSGWDTDITIPAKINGKAVTAIGGEAFKNTDLTSVVIPDSVKTIGKNAFSGNKLTKLTMGKGIFIEGNAFTNNKLTSVAIPDGAIISSRTMYDDGGYSGGESAFRGNQLTNITIGNNVIIDDNTFPGAKLTKVTLGVDCLFSESTGFGYFAYYSYMCNGRKAGIYTIDAEWDKNWSSRSSKDYEKVKKTADGYTYAETPYGLAIIDYKGESKRLSIPDKLNNKPVTYIEGLEKKELTGVRIPDSVVSIGDEAFYENQLTSVTFGKSVTYIGRSAFASGYQDHGNKLTNVVIPDSVVSIGNRAFYRNQLSSVIIGNGVTFIGDEAFDGDHYQLMSITIGNSVTSIGYSAFPINPLTSITIPANVLHHDSNFFYEAYDDNGKKAGTYTHTYNDRGRPEWAFKAR
jgi:hypothetical protein